MSQGYRTKLEVTLLELAQDVRTVSEEVNSILAKVLWAQTKNAVVGIAVMLQIPVVSSWGR